VIYSKNEIEKGALSAKNASNFTHKMADASVKENSDSLSAMISG
jgi:hypothetical protein